MSEDAVLNENGSIEAGFCRLQEDARLYLRPAGQTTLQKPQSYLGDFEAGALYVPLQAPGVEFELHSKSEPGRVALTSPSQPDGAMVDTWIANLANWFATPAANTTTALVRAGSEPKLVRGSAVTAESPTWLVSEGANLVLAPLQRGQAEPVSTLPVFGELAVTTLESVSVGALSSRDFLREIGSTGLALSARAIAACLADRHQALWQTRREKITASAELDDKQFRAAGQRILSITGASELFPSHVGATDPLLAALGAIGQKEGFEVHAELAELASERFDQQLERIAHSCKFRFREISLTGSWWQEEGPSLLLWDAQSQEARAAFWRGRTYWISDPENAQPRPIDSARAQSIGSIGYVLYPSLPNELNAGAVRRFAVHGAKRDLWALVLTGVVAVLIGLLVPVATGVVVATAIPDGRPHLLAEMGLLMGAAAIGIAGFTAARSLASIRASSQIDLRLQAAVWDRILRLPPDFFRGFATGDLVQRVLAVDMARRLLTGPVLSSLLTGSFAGVSFFLMLIYDLRLALYGLVVTVIAAGGFLILARRELRQEAVYQQSQGRVTARVLDLLTGVAKLRVAAAEERAFANWADVFADQQRARWLANRVRVARVVFTTALPSFGMLGVFAVAGFRSTPIDLASFSAFNAAFGQFIASIMAFSLALGAVVKALPLIKRAQPIFQAQPEIDESRRDPGRLNGAVTVRNLSFRYSDRGGLVLDGIDFDVMPGQFIALVGPSGSGKSTLLRMLLGFEAPQSGAVFYDDRDLAHLDLRLVRRQIGTVLQNAGLMPGSLYDNIAGAAPLSDQAVMDAARQAGLADDIAKFPMGLDTFVSEDAGTLSGGQKQRVVIARALAKKPPIVLFDEATSALDNRTQAVVSDSLEKLRVTRIVIAHRLSTVRHADKILLLEKGRIVEAGTYDELWAQNGAFRRLAERQVA